MRCLAAGAFALATTAGGGLRMSKAAAQRLSGMSMRHVFNPRLGDDRQCDKEVNGWG
ncbi:hypothetical protein ABIA16_003755 [Sinorhizobium fredii]